MGLLVPRQKPKWAQFPSWDHILGPISETWLKLLLVPSGLFWYPIVKSPILVRKRSQNTNLVWKFFGNFKNQLTSKGLCVLLDLWWAHVRLGTQDGLVHIVLDLTWAWWHRIFADPIWYSKSIHRLTQYFGTIFVIKMHLLIMFGPKMVRHLTGS